MMDHETMDQKMKEQAKKEQEEEKLLLEIYDLYNKLEKEPNGDIDLTTKPPRIIKPNGNLYVANAEALLAKMAQLNNLNPKVVDEWMLKLFHSRIEKGVSLIKDAYEKAIAPKAPHKRMDEFESHMRTLTQSIKRDINSLLTKAQLLKNEEQLAGGIEEENEEGIN